MFDQIKNRKGEKLCILIIANTNSIKPYTYVNTWEECLKKFEECTKELDNDSFFAQIIHKNISEETHTVEASDIETLILGIPFIKVNNTLIEWEIVNLGMQ